jgi:bifunctional non-homologous end joining protein LigD
LFTSEKHHARTLHYDLRLEKDGVFKSWAVPKGVPEDVGVKRLAIQVDDHALEFGDFEGKIPAGEYGVGHVEIWDRGTYESASWSDDEITFKFNGTRLQGKYTLTRFPRGGEKAWLVFKRSAGGKSPGASRLSGCCAKLRRDSSGFW